MDTGILQVNPKPTPVEWIGSSRRDLKAFPRAVQRDIGQALFAAQCGEEYAGVIYVLHAFQKKSSRGIATPQREIDLIHRRLAAAEQHHKERRKADGKKDDRHPL